MSNELIHDALNVWLNDGVIDNDTYVKLNDSIDKLSDDLSPLPPKRLTTHDLDYDCEGGGIPNCNLPEQSDNTISSVLNDLLVTALEGGSNYWADIVEHHYNTELHDLYYGTIMEKGSITIGDEDGQNMGKLNRESMINGLILMRKGEDASGAKCDKYKEHYADLYMGNWDATTADVWLQLSVFGEVIFG